MKIKTEVKMVIAETMLTLQFASHQDIYCSTLFQGTFTMFFLAVFIKFCDCLVISIYSISFFTYFTNNMFRQSISQEVYKM